LEERMEDGALALRSSSLLNPPFLHEASERKRRWKIEIAPLRYLHLPSSIFNLLCANYFA